MLKKHHYNELWTARNLSQHLANILDLDGVICDHEHRRHFIPHANASVLERDAGWRAYQNAQANDKFYNHVYRMFCYLSGKYPTARRIVLTGRNESARQQTAQWLDKHGVEVDEMYMRRDGDHRANHVVKADMLERLREENITPFLAFEDNSQTCKMMLEQKIHVYECIQGIITPFVITKPSVE